MIDSEVYRNEIFPIVVSIGTHAAYALPANKYGKTGAYGIEYGLKDAAQQHSYIEIIKFLKRLIAKRKEWQIPFPPHSQEGLGIRILSFIEKDLAEKAKSLSEQQSTYSYRTIYRLLIRQFLTDLENYRFGYIIVARQEKGEKYE